MFAKASSCFLIMGLICCNSFFCDVHCMKTKYLFFNNFEIWLCVMVIIFTQLHLESMATRNSMTSEKALASNEAYSD